MRDELAQEISQKLAIDSAVLRQELRHAAATRETSARKAPAEAQVTEAEKILIRALASARQMHPGDDHISARDGAEEEFDPARQASSHCKTSRFIVAFATESLVETLLNAGRRSLPMYWTCPQPRGDRRMLASILLKEDEELTAEVLEGAVRALRRFTSSARTGSSARTAAQARHSADPER